MAEIPLVFISSTSRDLQPYRRKVRDAVMHAGMHPIDMADFVAMGNNAMQRCYNEVQRAEIFIGIYAHRYGYTPESDKQFTKADGSIHRGDGKTSITHWEYLWARERGIIMLLFVVAEENDDGTPFIWDGLRDEDAKPMSIFKNHIKEHHVINEFTTPEDLRYWVAQALHPAKEALIASAKFNKATTQTSAEAPQTTLPTPDTPSPASNASTPIPPVPNASDDLHGVAWRALPAGVVSIEGVQVTVRPCQISQVPITNAVYEQFILDDGYKNEAWWQFSPFALAWWQDHQNDPIAQPDDNDIPDAPKTYVNWYEAMAFCQWASHKLNATITLPDEAQWQYAAQGNYQWAYPWGEKEDGKRNDAPHIRAYAAALTLEVGEHAPVPVTTYHQHPSPFGLLDMGGNVSEWCVNPFDITTTDLSKTLAELMQDDARRTIRGASFRLPAVHARNDVRYWATTHTRRDDIGFRIISL
jgi:formylglycine-generating enzyme required for sulfatase activity